MELQLRIDKTPKGHTYPAVMTQKDILNYCLCLHKQPLLLFVQVQENTVWDELIHTIMHIGLQQTILHIGML